MQVCVSTCNINMQNISYLAPKEYLMWLTKNLRTVTENQEDAIHGKRTAKDPAELPKVAVDVVSKLQWGAVSDKVKGTERV